MREPHGSCESPSQPMGAVVSPWESESAPGQPMGAPSQPMGAVVSPWESESTHGSHGQLKVGPWEPPTNSADTSAERASERSRLTIPSDTPAPEQGGGGMGVTTCSSAARHCEVPAHPCPAASPSPASSACGRKAPQDPARGARADTGNRAVRGAGECRTDKKAQCLEPESP